MRTILFLVVIPAALAMAERVDRLAVAVERSAIMESEILDHLRVASFLEGKPLDVSPRARRAAAH